MQLPAVVLVVTKWPKPGTPTLRVHGSYLCSGQASVFHAVLSVQAERHEDVRVGWTDDMRPHCSKVMDETYHAARQQDRGSIDAVVVDVVRPQHAHGQV